MNISNFFLSACNKDDHWDGSLAKKEAASNAIRSVYERYCVLGTLCGNVSRVQSAAHLYTIVPGSASIDRRGRRSTGKLAVGMDDTHSRIRQSN